VAGLLSSASDSVLFQDKSKNTAHFAEVAAQVGECRFLEELGASLSKDTRDVWSHIQIRQGSHQPSIKMISSLFFSII
jgi:hypothetical protein